MPTSRQLDAASHRLPCCHSAIKKSKGGLPPGGAIRGLSRPLTALDPKLTAQDDSHRTQTDASWPIGSTPLSGPWARKTRSVRNGTGQAQEANLQLASRISADRRSYVPRRAIPCSEPAQQRHNIIPNRVDLVSEESVSVVTVGTAPTPTGDPTHAHLHHWQ